MPRSSSAPSCAIAWTPKLFAGMAALMKRDGGAWKVTLPASTRRSTSSSRPSCHTWRLLLASNSRWLSKSTLTCSRRPRLGDGDRRLREDREVGPPRRAHAPRPRRGHGGRAGAEAQAPAREERTEPRWRERCPGERGAEPGRAGRTGWAHTHGRRILRVRRGYDERESDETNQRGAPHPL